VPSNYAERLDCGAFTAAVARDWSSLPREQFPVAGHRQAGFAEGEGNSGAVGEVKNGCAKNAKAAKKFAAYPGIRAF